MRSPWIMPLAGAAFALVACGSSRAQSTTPSTAANVEPSTTQAAPTAFGGGPRDDGKLTPSPYNSVGGESDDTMNSSPTSEGVAPTSEQPDAKANATVKTNKPAPNGRR